MTTAPHGLATGLPATMVSSCLSAPVFGLTGASTAPVSAPQQSPMQVGIQPVGGGFGAPIVPTHAATAATVGAAAIGSAPAMSNITAGEALMTTMSIATPGAASSVTAVPNTPGLVPVAATAPAMATTAVPAAQRLTSVAPGGQQGDADLVERTLGVLRQSQAGARIVDRMLAVGARVNVISDVEFNAMGHGDAHAFYDPKIDTMFLRRSDLADNTNARFAALALAHEGTHLLDDVGKVSDPFTAELTQRVVAAGGMQSPQGIAARDQGLFELMMIKETRAFVYVGQVARELGMQLPASDPTATAVAGGNDTATYGAVWQRLLQSSYNDQQRTAAVRSF